MARPLPSDTLVVFAYAQAGLGHIRVADAIFDGMPQGSTSILLASRDVRITYLHRLTSIHPIFRQFLEFMQNGWPEDLFTWMFQVFFARNNKVPHQELTQILNQSTQLPKTILIIATHFGLAHQFAGIKVAFAKAHGVRVILVVVVTDDSPQKVWAVPGADIIFCPSTTTKVALEGYHRRLAPQSTTVYVASPYMITQSFAQAISPAARHSRQAACDPSSSAPISVVVPVSGAAVQLGFLFDIIHELGGLSERFHFEVVSKESPFTNAFLHRLAALPRVTTHVSAWDRVIIEKYEALYRNIVITAEITKPSEQAFKALLSPRQVGGSILFFSEPVGRQERDNLAFFRRHDLIPLDEEQEQLWDLAKRHLSPDDRLRKKAIHWRGLRLPHTPHEGAQFIAWTLHEGMLQAIVNFSQFPEDPGLHSDGVKRFWKYMADYLQKLPAIDSR